MIILVTTASLIALLVNWYNNTLLPLINQFILIPDRMNEFIYLRPIDGKARRKRPLGRPRHRWVDNIYRKWILDRVG
jgi:hypothetical protein